MERKKAHAHLKYMILSALFAAMIYIMTALVHIPTHQGYVHIGDGCIFLAAALLPAPYAMGAAAIGAGLSDYLSGYALWVVPTMIIKAAMASVFVGRRQNIICKRSLFCLVPASVICVGGYYIAGALLAIVSGSAVGAAFSAAVADIPSNVIQCIGSAALFVFLGTAMDKTGVGRLISD